MKRVCTVHRLTATSFALGSMTAGMLALAVATDAWLYMNEPLSLTPQMRKDHNLSFEGDFKIMTHIRTGLWRVCTINLGNGTLADLCMPVDYAQKGTGRMEGVETSMAIVGATRISAPMTVLSLLLALVAVILNVTGSIHSDGKTLLAASFYVLSGLSLAVGIVLYISAINDEVGHKLGNKKDFTFTYSYGWSFFTAGLGFIAAEVSAVVCVTLYLVRNERVEDMMEIIPGLEDKLDSDWAKRLRFSEDYVFT